MRMPDISVDDLLDGPVGVLCKQLPAYPAGQTQVTVMETTVLSATAMTGATTLCAMAPFRCTEPLPEVRDLFLSLSASIDATTAACFSALLNLRVESKQPLRLSWFGDAPLEALSLRDRSLESWPEMRERSIKRLRIDWSGQSLSALPQSIVRLSLGASLKADVALLAPIYDLPRLRSLTLRNIRLASLRDLSKARSLEEVTVSTRSLKGVGQLQGLRSLRIEGVSCPPLSELASNETLQTLEIRARQPPADLAAIGALRNLRRLVLDFGDLYDIVDIESVGFLRSLPHLRDLEILTVRLIDQDLSPLDALSDLAVLRLVGDFGSDIARVSSRTSEGLKTVIHPVGTGPTPGFITPIKIDGVWTLFEDLTTLLCLETNYEVEKEVKTALKVAAPDVAGRIEFDSEAGTFCARTSSRADSEVLAQVIRTLIADATTGGGKVDH